MKKPRPEIVDLANTIVIARKGAHLLARVFESWDYWQGNKLNDSYSGVKTCPGCCVPDPDAILTYHQEGCWFAEARQYLQHFGIIPPDIHG